MISIIRYMPVISGICSIQMSIISIIGLVTATIVSVQLQTVISPFTPECCIQLTLKLRKS